MTAKHTTPVEPEADWSILDDERVVTIIDMVAASVGAKYSSVTTSDDVHQDASLHCALRADEVRDMLENNSLVAERWLFRWLYADMVNANSTAVARSKRLVPLADPEDGDAG